jgi:JAB1/Mov34/MPN/PAD-1 ubiquitin protease
MITEAGPLNLKIGSLGATCKVHPTVLVTICDSFIRRPAGSARVIGTLLGNEGPDNSIVVKACYAVPHEETEEQVRPPGPYIWQPLQHAGKPWAVWPLL